MKTSRSRRQVRFDTSPSRKTRRSRSIGGRRRSPKPRGILKRRTVKARAPTLASRTRVRRQSRGRKRSGEAKSTRTKASTAQASRRATGKRRSRSGRVSFGRDAVGGIPVTALHRCMKHRYAAFGRYSRLGSGMLAMVGKISIERLLNGSKQESIKERAGNLRAIHVLRTMHNHSAEWGRLDPPIQLGSI